MKNNMNAKCWVGLDWGDNEHSVCMLDSTTMKTTCFEAKHTAAGVAEIITRLTACGEVLGIAVETHRHLVVEQLLQAGFVVYSINPKVAKAWRDGWKAQPSKTDRIDAEIMAHGLMQHHDRMKPFQPGDERTRELAMLCDDEMSLIGQRTALVNQLQATLKQYYPQIMELFDDWTCPTAWDFLLKYSKPELLQQASKKTLIGMLKTRRIGLSPKWLERVERARKTDAWRLDPATVSAKSLLALSLAKQLKQLEAALKVYRKRIDELFQEHPQAEIFSSLPGAGPKLAPRLLARFGMDLGRYDSAEGPQQLSGTVPVSMKSGGRQKAPTVLFRRAVQKNFRTTMHLFAWCSTMVCPWARAFYRQARQNGQSNALALRNLAAKWLKIIYRMWMDGKPYNEGEYLNALIKHGSPLIRYMNSAA